jgi:hypothetical protein
MEALASRPPRVTLVNLETQARMECLINPETLTEKLSVLYRRLSVPGVGHQMLQYDSTTNRVIPGLELVFDKRIGKHSDRDPDLTAFRDFLRAAARPAQVDLPSAPPTVLFVWPKVLSMECVLSEVEFRYQAFGAEGDLLMYTATCTLEEVVLPTLGGVA